MSDKILFTDLDGTLLTSKKNITPKMRCLLTEMVQSGTQLVLTSGRALDSIIKVAQKAELLFPGTIIIAANGNEIYDYDGGRFLLQKSVPMDISQGIIDLAHTFHVHIHSYTDTRFICEREDEESAYYKQRTGMEPYFTEDIMKTIGHAPYKLLAIDLHDHERLERLAEAILAKYEDTVTCIFSCNEYLEIFDKTAGKGNAVRFVADLLQIPLKNCVAAGDAENDITMLDAAGIGVAMANAAPAVKEHADFVTKKDNDHDGLSEAILKYLI